MVNLCSVFCNVMSFAFFHFFTSRTQLLTFSTFTVVCAQPLYLCMELM